ncbi:hypothetical protein ABK040_005795 [Willaertia magna]
MYYLNNIAGYIPTLTTSNNKIKEQYIINKNTLQWKLSELVDIAKDSYQLDFTKTPLTKTIVTILGDQSSGKSSFINYLFSNLGIRETGVNAIDTQFTIVECINEYEFMQYVGESKYRNNLNQMYKNLNKNNLNLNQWLTKSVDRLETDDRKNIVFYELKPSDKTKRYSQIYESNMRDVFLKYHELIKSIVVNERFIKGTELEQQFNNLLNNDNLLNNKKKEVNKTIVQQEEIKDQSIDLDTWLDKHVVVYNNEKNNLLNDDDDDDLLYYNDLNTTTNKNSNNLFSDLDDMYNNTNITKNDINNNITTTKNDINNNNMYNNNLINKNITKNDKLNNSQPTTITNNKTNNTPPSQQQTNNNIQNNTNNISNNINYNYMGITTETIKKKKLPTTIVPKLTTNQTNNNSTLNKITNNNNRITKENKENDWQVIHSDLLNNKSILQEKKHLNEEIDKIHNELEECNKNRFLVQDLIFIDTPGFNGSIHLDLDKFKATIELLEFFYKQSGLVLFLLSPAHLLSIGNALYMLQLTVLDNETRNKLYNQVHEQLLISQFESKNLNNKLNNNGMNSNNGGGAGLVGTVSKVLLSTLLTGCYSILENNVKSIWSTATSLVKSNGDNNNNVTLSKAQYFGTSIYDKLFFVINKIDTIKTPEYSYFELGCSIGRNFKYLPLPTASHVFMIGCPNEIRNQLNDKTITIDKLNVGNLKQLEEILNTLRDDKQMQITYINHIQYIFEKIQQKHSNLSYYSQYMNSNALERAKDICNLCCEMQIIESNTE